MVLTRHTADDPALPAILSLIRDSFAYMDGVIDPPSSMHLLTLDTLRAEAAKQEIWSIGPPLSACAIFTPQADTLYVGKLCVVPTARGQGLSRQLIEHAAQRAHALKLPTLTLQSRIELTENHATFGALGFKEIGCTSHEGYDAATSITFMKLL